jgi:hypothetical protein
MIVITSVTQLQRLKGWPARTATPSTRSPSTCIYLCASIPSNPNYPNYPNDSNNPNNPNYPNKPNKPNNSNKPNNPINPNNPNIHITFIILITYGVRVVQGSAPVISTAWQSVAALRTLYFYLFYLSCASISLLSIYPIYLSYLSICLYHSPSVIFMFVFLFTPCRL